MLPIFNFSRDSVLLDKDFVQLKAVQLKKPCSLLNEGISRKRDDSETRRGKRSKSDSASNSVAKREVSITTLHRGLIVI
ncbi:hypothetical protein HHX47_DHR3001220 [Lentinula edodes]|nr:hypothetical protein HHX47_DHR3001220 [Lentinula edodes]